MANEASLDARSLAASILNRLENLILEAEKVHKPLEVDPFRRQLFELFVTAEAAGYVEENADTDLTAEAVCRRLAKKWGLADATRDSFEQQTKLPAKHLAKMRLLWSVMRMWMEWSYAWQRWPEFHPTEQDRG